MSNSIKKIYSNGDIYEGESKEGFPHGKGKMIYKKDDYDRKMYEGEWKNYLYHGKGKILWTNGDTYEGEFVNWPNEVWWVRTSI